MNLTPYALRLSPVKRIIMLGIIILLTSCHAFWEPMPKSWNWGIKPRPTTGMRNFPPTDTEYGKGFKDGCSSAFDAVSRGMPSGLYPKFDYKRMQKSSDYNDGWWDGYEQCTYIIDWEII